MIVKIRVNDRKTVVKAIGDLLGIQPKYMKTPTFAFQIGEYTVTKQNTVVVEASRADFKMLNQLASEGLIKTNWERCQQIELQLETPPTQGQQGQESETCESLLENQTLIAHEDNSELHEDTGSHKKVSIRLPLQDHSCVSLRNLLQLIYSKQQLINKALGGPGVFSIPDELIKLLEEKMPENIEGFLHMFSKYVGERGNVGIDMKTDSIIFTELPFTQESDLIKAYTDLVALMNKQAKEQKRVQTEPKEVENEKYYFRVWLIRLGFKGNEYKMSRKVLLRNLDGNIAFRTEAEKKRAEEKAKQKRQNEKQLNNDLLD